MYGYSTRMVLKFMLAGLLGGYQHMGTYICTILHCIVVLLLLYEQRLYVIVSSVKLDPRQVGVLQMSIIM